MILIKYHIVELLNKKGASPFRKWIESLPVQAAARVQARLYSAELGNLGDHKPLGNGIFELRVHLNPGYRIYFGRGGACTLIMIGGGTKGTQSRDISRAKRLWHEHNGEHHDKKKR
jgi:putative addiction module killer protein